MLVGGRLQFSGPLADPFGQAALQCRAALTRLPRRAAVALLRPHRPLQTQSEYLPFHCLEDPIPTFLDERLTPQMMPDHSAEYEYDTLQDFLT